MIVQMCLGLEVLIVRNPLLSQEREKLLKEHLGHPSGELPASTEGNGKKEPPTVPLAPLPQGSWLVQG